MKIVMRILILATHEGLTLVTLSALSFFKIEIYLLGLEEFRRIHVSRNCKKFFVCETDDFVFNRKLFLDRVNGIIKEEKIDILLPIDMVTIYYVATQKDRFTTVRFFPIPPRKLLKKVDNKWTFTQFLKKNNLPCPPTQLITKSQELRRHKFLYPVMVKALNLMDGKGMHKIESESSLYDHIVKLEKQELLPVVVQKYIEGDDLGVNILAHNGKVIACTIQRRNRDGGVELIINHKLLNLTKYMLRKLRYTGIANFDIKYQTDQQRIYFLECNPRVWGSTMASVFAGINFIGLGLSLTNNIKLEQYYSYNKISYLPTTTLIKKWFSGQYLPHYISMVALRDILMIMRDPLLYIILLILPGLKLMCAQSVTSLKKKVSM